MRVRIRITRLLGTLAVAALAAAGGITVRPSRADAALAYTASAAASGIRVSETVPGGPGSDTLFDGGGPAAQALLATGGTSASFASNPYPGDAAVAFPGQMRGLAPQAPPLPDYPFYVSASYPTNPSPDAVASPGGVLTASATLSGASARAASGGGTPETAVGLVEGRAKVDGGDESVSAQATSSGRSVAIGPLHIGTFVSTASVVLDSTGVLNRQSSFEVTGMTVAGQGLTLDEGQIVLAGTNMPLPEAGPLAEALNQAGLQISYVGPRETKTGLISEAIMVRRLQETPSGVVSVDMAFGQAVASIDGAVVPGGSPSVGGGDLADGRTSTPTDDSAPSQTPAATAASPTAMLQPSVGPGGGALLVPRSDNGFPAPGELPPTPVSGTAPRAGEPASPSPIAPGTPLPQVREAPADSESALPPVQLASPAAQRTLTFDARSSYLALGAATAAAIAAQFIARGAKKWKS